MSTHWERVSAGRYATKYEGHILQAIRKDGPYDRSERPYVAIVDRVPLEPGEWSLNRAKTRAIHHVQRQLGKAKAERLFMPKAEIQLMDTLDEVFDELEASPLPIPEPEPEPIPEPKPVPEPEPEPIQDIPEPEPLAARHTDLPVATITATILDGNTLQALNSLKETLSLIREIADVQCTISLPPTMEL